MPVFNNALAGAAGSGGAADYTIQRSLRFNREDGSNLSKTFSTSGDQTKFTWSFWFKGCDSGSGASPFLIGVETDNANRGGLYYSGETLRFYSRVEDTTHFDIYTDAVLRDPSAWYHCVISVDVVKSFANGGFKIYINGVDTPCTASIYTQGQPLYWNAAAAHAIGIRPGYTDRYYSGMMADIHMVDGLQLAPDGVFGEFDATTGVWNPIEYTGEYRLPVNQAQTWSSFGGSGTYSSTYDWTQLFDSDSGSKTVPANGSSITADFTSLSGGGIAYTSSLEVYYRRNTSAPDVTVNGSGINAPNDGKNHVYKVTGSGTLTSVGTQQRTTAGAGDCSLLKIVIDGKELVDQGVTPISNGFHLDFDPTAGTTYSNGVSSTSTANSSYPASNGFDGSVGSSGTANWYTQGSNQTITVDLSSYNVTASSSVGFNVRLGGPGNSATVSVTATIGGTAYTQTFQNSSTQDQLLTFNGSGAVTTIVATLTQANSSYGWGFTGVQVDGRYLVDHSAPGADASGSGNHWTANNLLSSGILSSVAQTVTITGNTNSGRGPYSKTAPKPGAGDAITDPEYSGSLQSGNNSGDAVTVSFNPAFTGVIYAGNSGGGVVSINGGTEFTPQSNVSYALNPIAVTNCTSFYSKTTASGQRGWISVAFRDDGTQVYNSSDVYVDVDDIFDSPTNYDDGTNIGGNYATLNPLDSGSNITFSNGNLQFESETTSGTRTALSSIGMSSGKWYFEGQSLQNPNVTAFGIATKDVNRESYLGQNTSGWSWLGEGSLYHNGNAQSNFGGVGGFAVGDIVGIAFDADNGTLKYYKNGTLVGTAYSGLSYDTYFFAASDTGSTTCQGVVNFGQNPFVYTPPTGYKALCTTNFDDPLINNSSEHFDTKLYTGNGGEQIVGGGIRYSDYVTGDIDSSFPAWRAFRNVTSSVGVRTQTASGATIVFQPPTPIAFSTSFKIWAARDGTHSGTSFTVTHAGGDTDFTSSVVTSTTQTAVDLAQISGVTSPITKITVVSGGPNPRFSGIEVDGSMLIDSTADAYDFSPDLVWLKKRNAATSHQLTDTVRGATKFVRSNTSGTEVTDANTLTSFNSDGFKVGTDPATNGASDTFVSWGWDAGNLASNSAYNQSQNWTSLLTSSAGTISNPGNSFDGSTSTTSQLPSTSAGSYIQLGATLTGVTKLEVYQRSASDVSGTGIQTYNNCPAAQWVQLTLTSSTISNIRFEKNTNDPGIYAIRVNDKILVDPGLIPAGSMNSSVYDQSDTWTDDFSGPSGSINFVGEMFDGSLNTETYPSTHPATITWTPSGGLAYTSMRINARTQANHSNGVKYKVVGGSEVSIGSSTTATWYTLPANSTLEYIKIERPSGSNAAGLVAAVEKDGKILVNDTATPANVPSVPSTVRANPTAGFSIVKYSLSGSSAQTIAHGLNSSLGLLLTKATGTTNGWAVWHSAFSGTEGIAFTSGSVGTQTWWNQSNMTSNVFAHKAGTTSPQGGDIIAYCFAPVAGYSAFGSYETSTPFVYTGFRPAFLIIKSTSSGRNWIVLDSARDTFNRTDRALLANDAAVEDDNSTYSVDFLSNGFKVLGSNGQITGDSKYIYFCFAENPFKTARAR